MQPTRFSRQVESLLPEWVAKGWVHEAHRQALLDDAAARSASQWNLAGVIATLGSILVFVGVISLVAANFDDMTRTAKLAWLFGGMFLSFIAAYYAQERHNAPNIGAALALLGTLFFGCNIMLIAQIYNLQADPPAGVMVWALGALAVTALWRSQIVGALGFVLTGIWNIMAITEHSSFIFGNWSDTPHYGSLALMVVFSAIAIRNRWNASAHLAGIGLLFWCFETSIILSEDFVGRFGGLVLMAIIGLLMLAARVEIIRTFADLTARYAWVLLGIWLSIITTDDVFRHTFNKSITLHDAIPFTVGSSIAVLGLMAGIAGLLFSRMRMLAGALALSSLVALLSYLPDMVTVTHAQVYNDLLKDCAIILSILIVVASIATVIYGSHNNERFFINCGLLLFAVKVMTLYFDAFAGLFNQGLFFLGGGILVVALSVVLERQRRRLTHKALAA